MGKAVTPKNERHSKKTANRDFVANISCAVRCLVRAEREYTSLAGNGFKLASL